MFLNYEDITVSRVGKHLELKTLEGEIICFSDEAAKTLKNEFDSIFATEKQIDIVKEQIQELNQKLIDLGYKI